MFHIEAGFVLDLEFDVCAAGVVCTKLTALEMGILGYFDLTKTWASGHETTTAATMTYSFEYSTSDDPETAGKKSDMFLTPALNVKFSKSADVKFDLATCSASANIITTWSLDSDSNVPVWTAVTLAINSV